MHIISSIHQRPNHCRGSLHAPKSWVWLIFSLWYFVPLYYTPMDGLEMGWLVGAYFLFVGFYVWAIQSKPQNIWKSVAAMVLLAIVITPYSQGSSTFFSYIGFVIGFSYRTKTWLTITAALIALIFCLHYQFDYPFPFFAFPALSGLISMGIIG